MDKKTYFLYLTNPEKKIFDGKITKMYISGIEGDLSIFPGHAPLITIIKPGMIKIFPKDQKNKLVMYISGGILEVQPKLAIILSDTTIRGEDLDEIQALKIKKEAEIYINKNFDNKKKYIASSLKLAEAIAKLQIISLLKNK